MEVVPKTITLHTKGEMELVDITGDVEKAVKESKLSRGTVTIFVSGSTGALTTIEFEPGLIQDFPRMLERVASKSIPYKHEQMWHDGNGHSHVRASLLGPSLTVPFNNTSLLLGTWQQIVFVELDARSRSRSLIVQIIGE